MGGGELIVVLAAFAVFILFGLALAWADYATRNVAGSEPSMTTPGLQQPPGGLSAPDPGTIVQAQAPTPHLRIPPAPSDTITIGNSHR